MVLKRFIPLLIAGILILLMCFCCPAFAENLLKNADFSRISEDGLPEEWFTDAYILEPGYTVFGISEGNQEHPVAVSIQNIGENDARFAQTVEVEPETLYKFSGYVRADGVESGHGANLSIEGIYAFSDQYYDTEDEWQYIEYYGETGPEQDSVTVFARLGGYSGVSTGKAYFTGLSLEKTDGVPGDGIADLWYKAEADYDDEDEYHDSSTASPAGVRIWLLLIGILYSVAALFIIYKESGRSNVLPADSGRIPRFCTAAVLFLSLLIRVIISCFTDGYMVDVNCFLSWGHTMASVGPARFYEATSFCDYPPLYTYVLAFNSIVSGFLGGSETVSRIVFRFIPSLCDILGSWLLYRLLIRQKDTSHRKSFLFLLMALFNPAMILNSAAWGQMDSVLCLLLVCVALYAVRNHWKAALPLYVVAVLIKPQALMLGPLGLSYIVISWIRKPAARKAIIIGTGISLLVLAAGVIPFSLHQNWDWLLQLYARTLASYPYATVNTANFYYLLGGNWSAVDRTAHILAPVILAVISAAYGIMWYCKAKSLRTRLCETVISLFFTVCFIILACLQASWAWVGGFAMAFAFAVTISPAVRSADINLLPWLGGLLFILLYVFGVKMHERYIFPALLLLASAWVLKRDRRILYVLLLFTFTVFVNEGIVLDNSIRLGSQHGHLNSDTVWLADIISILNTAGALYAVWLSTDMLLPHEIRYEKYVTPRGPREWKCDRKLHWKPVDSVLLASIVTVYAAISLLTLGSTKAPQNGWASSSADEQIIFDIGEYCEDVEILYFAQVSRHDFTFTSSRDSENWEEETWAQMDQGQCWKWKYVTESYDDGFDNRTYYNSNTENIIRFSGRYFRLTSHQLGLKLNEVLFRNREGKVLPVRIVSRIGAEPDSELYSDPEALIDEQYSMEGLPAFPQTNETAEGKVQPSWWNSTYFDEIYHARTAYEFLQGTVPYETSHPPLGKVLMSAGVAVFGMTPFGWRFAGALAGILMLPGMYLLGKQLTKKTWIAFLACFLMAFDCMHLTQTQIATIDSFPVLFIIFAYFFMLRFIQTDIVTEKPVTSLISLGLCGLFMGLSIASKWIGIYAGAGLAILFFWHCLRTIRLRRGEPCTDGVITGTASDAIKRTFMLCAWCVLFFIAVPVILYLISYIPYMAYNSARIHSLGDYINEVWRAQVGMFNYHSTPNLGMDHPFYSPWWEWPIIGKPMYYASQQYLPSEYPVHHSIFAFGNPVIWYGGLAAILICVFRAAASRRYALPGNSYRWHLHSTTYDSRYAFMLIGLLAQYLPWVLVPRGTYIYHYFASLPFLMIAICLCFDFKGQKQQRLGFVLSTVFIVVTAVFFILLFPYASGMNVSAGWLDIGRSLLRIWY